MPDETKKTTNRKIQAYKDNAELFKSKDYTPSSSKKGGAGNLKRKSAEGDISVGRQAAKRQAVMATSATERYKQRSTGKSHGSAIAVMVTFMVLIIASLWVIISGTGSNTEFVPTPTPTMKPTPTTDPEAATVGSLVSDITYLAVVQSVDTSARLITVYDVENNENVVLTYTGSSEFSLSQGSKATAAQLVNGDLLQFKCIQSEGRILSASFTTDVWEKKNIDDFEYFPNEINDKNQMRVSFGGKNYHCSENVMILSEGHRKSFGDLLTSEDRFTIKGKGSTIYEIVVTTGHGKLQLSNFEDFVDGTIYIGVRYALGIDASGLYTLREGEYKVTVEHGKFKGTETVIVNRDQTTVFNVFDYGRGPIKYGKVTLNISPATAAMFIDGVRTDHTKPVELEYGVYNVDIECAGYESLSLKLLVEESIVTRDIYLTEIYIPPDKTGGGENQSGDDTGSDSGTGSSVNGSSTSLQGSGFKINEKYAIYFHSPAGASVRLENGRGESIELGVIPEDGALNCDMVEEPMTIFVYFEDSGKTVTYEYGSDDYLSGADIHFEFASKFN